MLNTAAPPPLTPFPCTAADQLSQHKGLDFKHVLVMEQLFYSWALLPVIREAALDEAPLTPRDAGVLRGLLHGLQRGLVCSQAR